MKKAFEKSILNLLQLNVNVVFLTADEYSTGLAEIYKRFPDRYYSFGISECNMVGAAAGLARTGFIPVVYTFGSFLCSRSFEFIRSAICFNNANVTLVGYASGVRNNNLGPTHHATEDIAVLRSLPNLSILSPASVNEIEPVLRASLNCKGPVYIRLGKGFETEIFETSPAFEIGKSQVIRQGKDITIISTGNIISNAVEAAATLADRGIDAEIINLSSIKPLDIETIENSIRKTKCAITVEEHQITGGIGSAVAEIIAENRIGCAFKRMGFADRFVTEYGWHKDILSQNGLSVSDIVATVEELKGVIA